MMLRAGAIGRDMRSVIDTQVLRLMSVAMPPSSRAHADADYATTRC